MVVRPEIDILWSPIGSMRTLRFGSFHLLTNIACLQWANRTASVEVVFMRILQVGDTVEDS
jgi:hypothetical protein